MYVGQRKRREDEPDRALPSLIDRLRVKNPPDDGHRVEEMKNILVRDLSALMNARRLFQDEAGVSEALCRSVINFGIPDLCGVSGSPDEVFHLKRSIRDAIERFEPRLRLDPHEPVQILTDSSAGRPLLVIEIKGEMRSDPYPVHLRIRTEVDKETGQCSVKTEEDDA